MKEHVFFLYYLTTYLMPATKAYSPSPNKQLHLPTHPPTHPHILYGSRKQSLPFHTSPSLRKKKSGLIKDPTPAQYANATESVEPQREANCRTDKQGALLL